MSGIELHTDRLIRVRDLITAQPELLNLYEDFVNGVADRDGAIVGHCFCIAGLAALDAGFITLRSTPRAGTARVVYDVMPVAEQLHARGALTMFRAAIGTGVDEMCGDRLMFLNNWPAGYQKQFIAATTPADRAKVAARRIDHFISSGGRT